MGVPALAHSLDVSQSVTRPRIAFCIELFRSLRKRYKRPIKKRPSSFSLGRTKSDFVVPPSYVAISRHQPRSVCLSVGQRFMKEARIIRFIQVPDNGGPPTEF